MSFIRYPGLIKTDDYTSVKNDIIYGRNLFVGRGIDSGWFMFQTRLKDGYNYVISQYLYYCLKDESGNILTSDYTIVNGKRTFGNGKVYAVGDKWYIYDDKQFVGQIPFAFTSEQSGETETKGNGWYEVTKASNLVDGDTLIFVGKGEFQGNENITYTVCLPCCKSKQQYGKFVDENENEKYFGIPIWEIVDSNMEIERSLNKVNGYYSYQIITFTDNKWIMDDGIGIFQGEQPQFDRDVVFKSQDGQERVVRFKKWDLGNNTTKIILGDIAKW